jgi:hypothetical protein
LRKPDFRRHFCQKQNLKIKQWCGYTGIFTLNFAPVLDFIRRANEKPGGFLHRAGTSNLSIQFIVATALTPEDYSRKNKGVHDANQA